jgi:PAS domain S-box-containing protein
MPDSTVPDSTAAPTRGARLRREAEARLASGTAPPSVGWTVSPEALSLLYRLASDPDRAGDALKLLYELQAHQVELDLQHGQMEADQRESAQDLARYRAMFDLAPVAYFVCDLDGRIIESNRAGTRLLGVATAASSGQLLAGLLAPDSRTKLIGLLKAVRAGASGVSCEVRPNIAGKASCIWRITASAATGGEELNLVVAEWDESERS